MRCSSRTDDGDRDGLPNVLLEAAAIGKPDEVNMEVVKAVVTGKADIVSVTIDPEVEGFDPHSLTRYYDDIGVRWHYEEQPIMEEAKEHMDGDSFCAYCARMKRGIMYSTCREHGYKVLALAQHLDDLAESFLMSAFHQGQLGTMKAGRVAASRRKPGYFSSPSSSIQELW